MTQNQTTFLDHMGELRKRLIHSTLAIVLGMVLGLTFAKPLYTLLQRPMLKVLPTGSQFITTAPLEAMMTYFKVALLAGIFVSLPYLFYQVWCFVAPGLHQKEKKAMVGFVTFSTLFFVGGASFGYFVIFPMAFQFFITLLHGTDIQFLPQMKNYLNFSIRLILAFGFAFELPLFIYFLAYLGLVTYESLKKARRYVVVVIFIASAILTPPDVISQILMGIPLIILYELSLLVVKFTTKNK
jgi:sec-independent protein translocase protein TatC